MSTAAIDGRALATIGAALVVAALPHLAHLPPWVPALVPAAVVLRLALGRPARRWVLIPLVLAVLGGVLAAFRSVSGPTAGGALFCAMVALKFLEAGDRRDAGLLLCLCYFLATSIFLTTQSIPMAAYVAGSVGVTTVALTMLAVPDGPPWPTRLRRVLALMAQALPIMIVLFVLFPRLPGPLWAIEQDGTATTGLGDRMSPGDITQLTRSSAVAFRVRFDDRPPPSPQRYWRGPVFWHFDGRNWTPGEPRREGIPAPARAQRIVTYELILEPHGRDWVFALDLPLGAEQPLARTPGYRLDADGPVHSVTRYRLRSALAYRLEPQLAPARRARALQLPAQAAPRARALAERWRRAADGPRGVIERALAHFRDNGFVYTLSPPALGGNPVDDFLFGTRMGFCEHYASAFAVLMRAAGIPARVVTGYQGGEINDLGDYMIVRQSDAHAWTELWIEGRGWTRVDPTAAVSERRIEAGIGSLPGVADSLPLMARAGSGAVKRLALIWDSVNHGWNRFVLGYGPALQRELLRRLGFAGTGRWALAALLPVVVGLVVGLLWLLALRRAPPPDPVERQWRRALARLQRAGIAVAPTEGPRDLAARVADQHPELAAPFGRVVEAYVALRYRPRAGAGALGRLREAVGQLPARAQPQRAGRTARDTRAGKWWPR